MTRMRMIHAINAALREELSRDERVILFGEDVGISLFGDTRDLQDAFGARRVRDTPISEAVIASMAVGAAATGLRPVCHLMFGNFLYLAWDAIANQAAKLRYMSGGQVRLPLVFMAVFGGGRSQAAHHSDAMHPMLMNLGGIKVAVPSTPADAKGLLKSAIRDDDPVVFLQSAGRGGELGEVPDGEHLVPFGSADIKRQGSDVTIVAIGAMVRPALRAAETLASEGISAEIVDPRTLVPLDTPAILRSVSKTGRLILVDEAREACSAASQIAAVVAESAFDALQAPIRRVTTPNVPMPYAPVLERELLPSEPRIVEAVHAVTTSKVGLQ
jgi:acetoin:2,6-dichlorophenolindophenol oxidoreductase subunit beta